MKYCGLFLLIVCIAFSIVDPVNAFQDGDYTYTLSGGNATVTNYTGPTAAITIPSTLGGYPVVAIGNAAFYGTIVTSVVIPDSVTSIGASAFYHIVQLTSVTIGNGLTSMGGGAFEECTALVTAHFGGNAPATWGSGVFNQVGVGVVIYYAAGATGWTNPFYGYATVSEEVPPAEPGTIDYLQLLSYSVYIGCVAPLVLLGTRIITLWGWSMIKKWGTT